MWVVTYNDIAIKLKRLFDIVSQPERCYGQYVHQYTNGVKNI